MLLIRMVSPSFLSINNYFHLSHNNNQNPALLRSKVISLLAEVPSGQLQLFKFREMFEKRFHASIGVSDLYKMREIVTIMEGPSGSCVWLILITVLM